MGTLKKINDYYRWRKAATELGLKIRFANRSNTAEEPSALYVSRDGVDCGMFSQDEESGWIYSDPADYQRLLEHRRLQLFTKELI